VGLNQRHYIETMSPADFKSSVSKKAPPRGLSPALSALWWAGKDEWDKAHHIVMNGVGADCAWVHAYLHRVEGDLGNAGYWYRQAERKAATGDFAAEWAAIVAALLAEQQRHLNAAARLLLYSVPSRPASFTTCRHRACSALMKSWSLSGGGLDCGTKPSRMTFSRTPSSATTARNAS